MIQMFAIPTTKGGIETETCRYCLTVANVKTSAFYFEEGWETLDKAIESAKAQMADYPAVDGFSVQVCEVEPEYWDGNVIDGLFTIVWENGGFVQ